MTAIVKTLKEMPAYLKLHMTGSDKRGTYGFAIGMQRKMGKRINIKPVGSIDVDLYDYMDDEGYKYREEWLKSIK